MTGRRRVEEEARARAKEGVTRTEEVVKHSGAKTLPGREMGLRQCRRRQMWRDSNLRHRLLHSVQPPRLATILLCTRPRLLRASFWTTNLCP